MKSMNANAALKLVAETTPSDEGLVALGARPRKADVRRLLKTAASSLMLTEANLSRNLLDVVFATTPATQGSVMLRHGNDLQVVAARGHAVAVMGATMPRGRGPVDPGRRGRPRR